MIGISRACSVCSFIVVLVVFLERWESVKSLRSCAPDFITRQRECFGSDELRLVVNEGNSGCMKKYDKRPEINVSSVMGRRIKV